MKSPTDSTFPPSIDHEEMSPDVMILMIFFNIEFEVRLFFFPTLLFHTHQEVL